MRVLDADMTGNLLPSSTWPRRSWQWGAIHLNP